MEFFRSESDSCQMIKEFRKLVVIVFSKVTVYSYVDQINRFFNIIDYGVKRGLSGSKGTKKIMISRRPINGHFGPLQTHRLSRAS